MRGVFTRFFVSLSLLGLAPMAVQGQTSDLSDAIRNRLEAGRSRGEWSAAGEKILAVRALPQVYADREFSEIWVADGRTTPGALQFLGYLRRAEEEGLRPEDYHLQVIDSLLSNRGGPPQDEMRRRIDLELLLTDAYLIFGSHLLQGRVDPVTINAEWLANRRNADLGRVLMDAAEGGAFVEALRALLPRHPGYSALKLTLARMRASAAGGGWEPIPEGATLREGETDPRIPTLRARLVMSGDHPPGSRSSAAGEDPLLFDPLLAEGVRRFQSRHGLEPDGAVGQATLVALNVPAADRVRQLEVNLERWRWLPEDLGSRHILVNIAGFSVTVAEGDLPVLEMRAIVGRQYRQTPVFSSRMTYLVLSPYWHVPPTIAAVDKLPEIKKNPAYVAAQRMTLLDASTNQPVSVASVDWGAMAGPEFNRRYRLRQDPGPSNALGDVKFMFPNPHNVYLHDTPSRELFARAERSFSSGCIRIEKPLDLAEYLLREDPSWTREGIRAAIERRVERTVTLRSPIPVHIQYWTAWVDRDGVLNFRGDLYGRDTVVQGALEAPPPGA
ncbi:MAG: L,D-transpeptidase family protein [Gemmatimonadetes bacterium]|nr:L,D-transpeptidase family protein [Gemmatimonadota bacterium]